jgi:hypothetical protein
MELLPAASVWLDVSWWVMYIQSYRYDDAIRREGDQTKRDFKHAGRVG